VRPEPLQVRGTQLTTAGVGTNTSFSGAFSSWENAERYVKELAIFGGNTIQLSHPTEGDAFTQACLGNWSRLLDKWDIDVSIWLPVDNAAVPFTPALAQVSSQATRRFLSLIGPF